MLKLLQLPVVEMISSPFCAVSVLNVCEPHTKECESMSFIIRNTYLISETFQILFPTASSIFTVEKLFHEVISERTKY